MLPPALRILKWTVAAIVCIIILIVPAISGWFLFYTSDLPDIESLQSFAPHEPVKVSLTETCGAASATVSAIPLASVGRVREAVLAVDGDFDQRGIALRLYQDHYGTASKKYGLYSIQLARQFFCNHYGSMLHRELMELRTSIQIERHFTTEQILAIYLNRAYYGDGVYGAENAAEHYFGKSCHELSPAEAALLAALLRRPSYLSPSKHPDRALIERNEVLDQMVERGALSRQDAENEKASTLNVKTR